MRIYLVVKHKKKEDNPIVLLAFQNKHKAKAKADELDNAVKYEKRKKIWHTIEKYDIVDLEGAVVQGYEKDCSETGDSKPSTSS